MTDFFIWLSAQWVARDEDGQGMLEYGLIITLVAVVVISALLVFGPSVSNLFNSASNAINA